MNAYQEAVPVAQDEQPALPQKDPNYVNKGIKIIIHYARLAAKYDNLYV